MLTAASETPFRVVGFILGLACVFLLYNYGQEAPQVAKQLVYNNLSSHSLPVVNRILRSTTPDYEEIRSSHGLLEVVLSLQYGTLQAGNVNYLNVLWNNTQFTGPTLRVFAGDIIRFTLINALLNEKTNLHFHGMTVSPREDDSLLLIDSNSQKTYVVHIPSSHPSGLFWYHSHALDISEKQVTRGIGGLIIVEGLLKPFSALLQNISEQHITLRSLPQPNATGPENGTSNASLRLLNNQLSPTVKIQPKEIQLWRVANMAADVMFDLRFEPPVPLYEIARDGHLLIQLKLWKDSYLISPGSRAEFLIEGPPEGQYAITSQSISNGRGPGYIRFELGTLNSTGVPFPNPPALPQPREFPLVKDLRREKITRSRVLDLSIDKKKSLGVGGPFWFINDTAFSADRIDLFAAVGDTERWTIINSDFEYHSFHTHQVPFQVVALNGHPVPFDGYQDTVVIPFAKPPEKAQIEIIVPFTDSIIAGKFLFHCHMLQHEDHGMMGMIQVSSSTSSEATYLIILSAISSLVLYL